MRTRSSRLFIVLLHLVSVSTDILVHHHNTSSNVGDADSDSDAHGGVQVFVLHNTYNPQAILLQRMPLPADCGLLSLLEQQQRQDEDPNALSLLTSSLWDDPFWLQVSTPSRIMPEESLDICLSIHISLHPCLHAI